MNLSDSVLDRRRWYRGSAAGVLLAAGVCGLLIALGCAGPSALSRAIRPQDREDYSRAIANDTVSPKRAFLAWRATRQGISLDDALCADAEISSTNNPFDANRDRHAVSLGAVVYATHCLRCHGENVDGHGPDVLPQAPCKDFHAFDKRLAVTLHRGAPKAWFAKIRDGHGDLLLYPDGPSTAMPAFGDALSKEQIWLAITYLQSLDIYVPAAVPEGT